METINFEEIVINNCKLSKTAKKKEKKGSLEAAFVLHTSTESFFSVFDRETNVNVHGRQEEYK